MYVSFVYLGHYYRDVLKNLPKARRCYEKAYQLSMNLDEIAEALSDIYRQLDCQVCILSSYFSKEFKELEKWRMQYNANRH